MSDYGCQKLLILPAVCFSVTFNLLQLVQESMYNSRTTSVLQSFLRVAVLLVLPLEDFQALVQ